MSKFFKNKVLYILSATAIIFSCLFMFIFRGPQVEAADLKRDTLNHDAIYANTNTSTGKGSYGNWSWNNITEFNYDGDGYGDYYYLYKGKPITITYTIPTSLKGKIKKYFAQYRWGGSDIAPGASYTGVQGSWETDGYFSYCANDEPFTTITATDKITFTMTVADPAANSYNTIAFSWFYVEYESKAAVTIAAGTGVKSVYLATTNNATSGSASGTEYDSGTTVYGYAELAKGYKAKSDWTLVSGTANTEGAKYRVSSVTAGSGNFGTISADAIQYSISYNLNGGTHGSAHPSYYYVTTASFTISNPTRTGYTFDGWSGTGITGKTKTLTISKGSIGNRTYTANWTANKYTISLVDNYPTGITENISVTYGNVLPTLNGLPPRSCYDFVGFFDDAIAGTQYYDEDGKAFEGKTYTLTTDLTLYAHWQFNAENLMNLINSIGEVKYPTSHDILNQVELTYYGILDEEDRNAFAIEHPEYVEILEDARTEYNALATEAVNQVIQAIDNIVVDSEGEVVYPASKASIENAESLYNALGSEEKTTSKVTNYNDLVQARSDYDDLRIDRIQDVIDAINAISNPFNANREEQITTAQSLFDSLDSSDKVASVITNLNKLVDVEAADDAADLIESLPTVSDTTEFRELVSQARTAYTNLTNNQKAYISDDLLNLLVSREKALEVIDSINAIGDVTYPGSKTNIDAANTSYATYIEAGYPAEFIVNYQALEDANTLYDDTDLVAAFIKAIPAASESVGYYNATDIAKEEFDELSLEGQALLSETAFDDSGITYAQYLFNHVAARDVIERIQNIGAVVFGGENDSLDVIVYAENGYNDLTDAQKAIVNGVNYDTLVHDREAYDHVAAVAELIMDIVPAEGEDYYNAVEEAETAYNALSNEEQAIINNSLEQDYEKILFDNIAASAVVEAIENIGDITCDGGINDSLEDIEHAESLYNLLSDDQKAIVDSVNHDTLIADRTSYDEVLAVATLIAAIGDGEYSEEKQAKITTARENYNNLTDYQKSIVYNSRLLFDNEVEATETLINNIGSVQYTSESKSLIDIATASYDELDSELKKELENYDVLLKANNDYNKVDTCVNKVNSLGNLTYSETCNDKIKNARELINDLTENQKAILPSESENTLVNYEEAYATLEKIHSIGKVEYTTETKKSVEDAREAYDELTPEQKALIDENDLNVLTDKENDFSNIKSTATTWGIILLILSIITLGAGCYFLFLLLRKKDEEDKNKKNTIQANSSILPLVILSSYFAAGPYLAFYIIISFAIAVWISVLVIYLLKKKGIIMASNGSLVNNEELINDDSIEETVEENSEMSDSTEDEEEKTETNESDEELEAEAIEQDSLEESQVETIQDASGNTFKIQYISSFTAKLIQSSDELKKQYSDLRKCILSYSGTKSKTTWHFDSISYGKEVLLRFGIRGKTLCVYYALDYNEFGNSKYKLENVTSKKYIKVPCLYRIKNDRRYEYAKELIEIIAKKYNLSKEDKEIEDVIPPYEDRNALIEKGLIKKSELKIK